MGWNEPSENQSWAEDEDYEYEIWSDDDKTLAVYYGAAYSTSDWFPSRVTMLLDANGTLILEYVDSVNVGTHPAKVLEDCQAIFGE